MFTGEQLKRIQEAQINHSELFRNKTK